MNFKKSSKIGLLKLHEFNKHFVREYENRLAIYRRDGQRMTWEELQEVKEIIWKGEIAIEVYPSSEDVINVKHTRHLWKHKNISEVVNNFCKHEEFKK